MVQDPSSTAEQYPTCTLTPKAPHGGRSNLAKGHRQQGIPLQLPRPIKLLFYNGSRKTSVSQLPKSSLSPETQTQALRGKQSHMRGGDQDLVAIDCWHYIAGRLNIGRVSFNYPLPGVIEEQCHEELALCVRETIRCVKYQPFFSPLPANLDVTYSETAGYDHPESARQNSSTSFLLITFLATYDFSCFHDVEQLMGCPLALRSVPILIWRVQLISRPDMSVMPVVEKATCPWSSGAPM